MNFQKLNAFSLWPSAGLLCALATMSPSAFAAQPEDNQPVSAHDHHMRDATMPIPMSKANIVAPASMHNVPDVEDVKYSEPEAYAKLATKDQMIKSLRNPDYSDGYQNTASHHMMSSANFWNIDAEKLELAHDDNTQQNSAQYELKLWYGNDNNRLYLNSGGEFAENELEQASTSLMWWRPVSTYWNITLGVKQDYQQNATANDANLKTRQTWLGGGISGLAPYWFDIEASLYGATQGHSQLELKASYDLNISQKWVLQPEVELRAYGKTSAEHLYGAGLAEVNTGVRLRYETTPQFAPYIGFEREQFVGNTAKLYKDHEGNSSTSKFLLGLRFWY